MFKFRVTFVLPGGWKKTVVVKADSIEEAERKAWRQVHPQSTLSRISLSK